MLFVCIEFICLFFLHIVNSLIFNDNLFQIVGEIILISRTCIDIRMGGRALEYGLQ